MSHDDGDCHRDDFGISNPHSSVYIDRHVPPSVATVQYQVTPIQRGGIGNAGPIATVQFGMVGATRAKAA